MHDLARVTKNLHIFFFLRPLFRLHDAPSPLPRGRSHVTEPDLNSPWEGPRPGSYCTHALGSQVGFLLYSHFFLAFVHAVHPVGVPWAFVHAVRPVRYPSTEGQGDPPGRF